MFIYDNDSYCKSGSIYTHAKYSLLALKLIWITLKPCPISNEFNNLVSSKIVTMTWLSLYKLDTNYDIFLMYLALSFSYDSCNFFIS